MQSHVTPPPTLENAWSGRYGRFGQRLRMGLLSVLVAAFACIWASPGNASLIAFSSADGAPLRLIVANDGVNPATFEVVTDNGGPGLATLQGHGPEMVIPAVLTLTGTLSGNANSFVFSNFFDTVEESIAHMDVSLTALDGRTIYATPSDWGGVVEKTSIVPYPNIPTTVFFRGSTLHPGIITDFAHELDVFGNPTLIYSGVISSGQEPVNDLGTILGNGSMSGFDVPMRSLGIGIDVPEPASWFLLVGGFAFAGAALRKRCRRANTQA